MGRAIEGNKSHEEAISSIEITKVVRGRGERRIDLKAASTISLMVVWQYLVKVSSMPSSDDDKNARR